MSALILYVACTAQARYAPDLIDFVDRLTTGMPQMTDVTM